MNLSLYMVPMDNKYGSCLFEVNSKKIRLELVKDRSSDILKKIILHHIGPFNTIINDGWEGYN